MPKHTFNSQVAIHDVDSAVLSMLLKNYFIAKQDAQICNGRHLSMNRATVSERINRIMSFSS